VALVAERRTEVSETLPARWVGKTWRNLWQRKVNAAWLPPEQVFLRVLRLPASEPSELPSMVEFQLERISPLPVGQVVWSVEPVRGREAGAGAAPPRSAETSAGAGAGPEPAAANPEQTVVVVIAAREPVERFLGDLEGVGFLADRLELPHLREMLATQPTGDEVCIYPRGEGDRRVCLAAWWVAGRLEHLSLLAVPSDSTAGSHLAQALRQTAWAGEMEGWLEAPPRFCLAADAGTAASLEPALRAIASGPIEVRAPLAPAKVAALCAGAGAPANLVPAEFGLAYRQQFIDRLWMRGLAALGMVYLVGLLAYFGALKFLDIQKAGIEKETAALADRYHEALQLKARVSVLQDQVNLKFAALDCWKAASENLPEEITLTSLQFQRGKKLVLFGTVPSDQQGKVTEYNEALSKAIVNGAPLFTRVNLGTIQIAPGPQGNRPATWSLTCDLKQTEAE